MGIDLEPGQPCYEARRRGCTCDWLRGFGVGEVREEWAEKIMRRDPDCKVHHDDEHIAR